MESSSSSSCSIRAWSNDQKQEPPSTSIKNRGTLGKSCCAPDVPIAQQKELPLTAAAREAGSTAEAIEAPAAFATDAAVTEAEAGAPAIAAVAANRDSVLEQEEKITAQILEESSPNTHTAANCIAGGYSSYAVGGGMIACPRDTLSILSLTCPAAFSRAVAESVLALATQQRLLVLCTGEALLENFVDKHETFIFDVDGVLLMGKRPLAGVAEGLAYLREKGKRLLFLTNSASKSRRMCVKVLRNAGIHAEFHEVVCSSYAAALHLQLRYPHVRKVLMIGEAGLEEELRAAGFEVVSAEEAAASRWRREQTTAGIPDKVISAAAPPTCSISQKEDDCVLCGSADFSDSGRGGRGAETPRFANICMSPPAAGSAGGSMHLCAAALREVGPGNYLCQTHAEGEKPLADPEQSCHKESAASCAAGAATTIATPANSGGLSREPVHQVDSTITNNGVGTAASSCSSADAPRQVSDAYTVCSEVRSNSGDLSCVALTSFNRRLGSDSLGLPSKSSSCAVRLYHDTAASCCQQRHAASSAEPPPPMTASMHEESAVPVLPASGSPSSWPFSSTSAHLHTHATNSALRTATPSSAAPSSDLPAPANLPTSSSYDASKCPSVILDEESFTSLACSLDPEVDAVVVGWDRRFDYFKIVVASLYLNHRNGSLPFLAANKDAFDVVGGWRMPANGAAVSALETAAGRTASCVGKPSAWLAGTLLRLHAIKPTTTIICGDRLDTDIAFGKHAGIHTCITLTGCTTPQQLLQMSPSHALRPDAVCPHIGLLRLVKATSSKSRTRTGSQA